MVVKNDHNILLQTEYRGFTRGDPKMSLQGTLASVGVKSMKTLPKCPAITWSVPLELETCSSFPIMGFGLPTI